ncbi:MAG: aminopeptidase P family protein, partial [Chloroflexi bacterium]|nr:aminopeptidase P family protein [Chloroflexota bacterium]
VWMDAGCTVGGYWSDYSRAAVVGPPSAAQREAQALVHEATMAGVRLIRPGVPIGEIAAACEQRLAHFPFRITSSISGLAGRVGHGIGLDATEPPHVSASNHAPLTVGMVISVEPGVATEDGLFHVEENVAVLEDGYEILSVAGRELYPIEA